MPRLMRLIAAVKSAQEDARTAKLMGDSLQSWVWLDTKNDEVLSLLNRYSGVLETLLGVSNVTWGWIEAAKMNEMGWSRLVEFDLDGGKKHLVTAHVHKPQQLKCTRCWKYKAPLKAKEGEALCERCEGLVNELKTTKPNLFEQLQ